MPTRYLKPGIRDSELIDRLSPPTAESLFYRLIVTVDDFGRTDARPAMIKAACFPIKKTATEEVCDKLLQELHDAGLIALYTVDGKPYLQMQKWDNPPRAKESKFPAPSDGCPQMHASVRKPRAVLPVTVTVTGTETENREPDGANARKRASRKAPADFAVTDEMRAWAAEHTPSVNVDAATAKFVDHTFAVAKTDWLATWRNWLRSDQERVHGRPAGAAPASKQEALEQRNAAVAAKVLADLAAERASNG